MSASSGIRVRMCGARTELHRERARVQGRRWAAAGDARGRSAGTPGGNSCSGARGGPGAAQTTGGFPIAVAGTKGCTDGERERRGTASPQGSPAPPPPPAPPPCTRHRLGRPLRVPPRWTKPGAGAGRAARTGGLRTECRCRGRGPVSLETVAQGTRRADPGVTRGRRLGPEGAGHRGIGAGARPGRGRGRRAARTGRGQPRAGTVGKFSQAQPGEAAERSQARRALETLHILPDPRGARPRPGRGRFLQGGRPRERASIVCRAGQVPKPRSPDPALPRPAGALNPGPGRSARRSGPRMTASCACA